MQTQAFFFSTESHCSLTVSGVFAVAYTSLGIEKKTGQKRGESVNQYVKLREHSHMCAHTEKQERVALAKRHFIVLEGVWEFSLFLLPVLDH